MRTFALALCLLLLLGTTTARSDYAETERRLKAAGVDPDLRAKIHKAIDRGVAFLLAQQDKDGSFKVPNKIGAGALAGLALRHAGTAKATQAAAKALQFLVGTKGRIEDPSRWRTYESGILAMLLMADRQHPELAARLAKRFVATQDRRTGWWGYHIWPSSSSSHKQIDRPNLSTTQFAMLGLWAASHNGAEVPEDTWRRHLESLIDRQGATGSWTYDPGGVRAPGPPTRVASGYPNGTMMGAANFALAAKACADPLRKDPAFYRKYLAARLRLLDAVRRDGQAMLAVRKEKKHVPHWDLYGLYALEKACLFLDLKRLGKVYWYREGARILLDGQNKDGGWGRGSGKSRKRGSHSAVVDTAFGLLFLLRSSEFYRPTTPSAIDGRVVTGGDPKKPFR